MVNLRQVLLSERRVALWPGLRRLPSRWAESSLVLVQPPLGPVGCSPLRLRLLKPIRPLLLRRNASVQLFLNLMDLRLNLSLGLPDQVESYRKTSLLHLSERLNGRDGDVPHDRDRVLPRLQVLPDVTSLPLHQFPCDMSVLGHILSDALLRQGCQVFDTLLGPVLVP